MTRALLLQQIDEEPYFTHYDFRDALECCLQCGIDDLLASEWPLHRALAMLDGRLGKRRFLRLTEMEREHPLVQRLYTIRAEAACGVPGACAPATGPVAAGPVLWSNHPSWKAELSTPRSARPAPIICLEGPSAIGKTTLAAALAREAGAAVIPELDASGAPPIAKAAEWFVDAHAGRWRRARALAALAPLVVMDGDPFKGLWFNPVFAEQGWPGIDAQAPRHHEHLARGTLAFPDLYVVLLATEAQLRARRAGDPTRTRRNHEMHLRLIIPQRRYYEVLKAADPPRVLLIDSTGRDALVPAVLAAVRALPPDPPDSVRLFDHMARWVAAHDPA